MNNTFNLRRFGLLLQRQWLEFGKIFLITLLVALGVIVAFYGFSTYYAFENPGNFGAHRLDFREPLFLVFGYLFITVIASSYFAHLGQKSRAAIDLMIPASAFEKFVAGVVYTAVLAVASYILLFYLVDLAFITKLRSVFNSTITTTSYTDARGTFTETTDNVAYFFTKNNPNKFTPIYVVPAFVTSIFLLGSVYFNRFHYIKTAISVLIFSGIWTFVIVKTGETVMRGKVMIHHNGNNSKDMGEPWLFAGLLLLTLIFWSITYVRLKEKEV